MVNKSNVFTVIHNLVARPEAEKGFTFTMGEICINYDSDSKMFTVVKNGRKIISYNVDTRSGSTAMTGANAGNVAAAIDAGAFRHFRVA